MMKHHSNPARLSLLGIALGLSLAVPVHAAEEAPAKEAAPKEVKKVAAPSGLRLVTELIATVVPTSGSKVSGTVTFVKVKGGVEVTAKISGLTPDSSHGFHIHDFGNLTAADGTSAGGHYNPEGHDHGLPHADMTHAGDLGNLKANAEGVAELKIVSTNITLAGAKNPIVGRAVVIHAKADDGGQPTGNAGDRIGVGVIGIAKVKPAEHKE